MFQEIEINGKKWDRYSLIFVEHAADGFMPNEWDLCVLDWSNMEIVYTTQITAAQAKHMCKRNPHLHVIYPRNTPDWEMVHRKVQEFTREESRTKIARIPNPMRARKPFLVSPKSGEQDEQR